MTWRPFPLHIIACIVMCIEYSPAVEWLDDSFLCRAQACAYAGTWAHASRVGAVDKPGEVHLLLFHSRHGSADPRTGQPPSLWLTVRARSADSIAFICAGEIIWIRIPLKPTQWLCEYKQSIAHIWQWLMPSQWNTWCKVWHLFL